MISGRRERLRRLSSITVSQMSVSGELSVPVMDHYSYTCCSSLHQQYYVSLSQIYQRSLQSQTETVVQERSNTSLGSVAKKPQH